MTTVHKKCQHIMVSVSLKDILKLFQPHPLPYELQQGYVLKISTSDVKRYQWEDEGRAWLFPAGTLDPLPHQPPHHHPLSLPPLTPSQILHRLITYKSKMRCSLLFKINTWQSWWLLQSMRRVITVPLYERKHPAHAMQIQIQIQIQILIQIYRYKYNCFYAACVRGDYHLG